MRHICSNAARRLLISCRIAAAAHWPEPEVIDHASFAPIELLRCSRDGGACRIREEPNNWYRLERAVQILLRTGKPTSASQMQLERPLSELPYDFRPFFITRPRIEGFRRIDERVELMVRSLATTACTRSAACAALTSLRCGGINRHVPNASVQLNLSHRMVFGIGP